MYTNIPHTKETMLERLKKFTEENKRLPNTHQAKLVLIRIGLLENKCSCCQNSGIWLEKPLSLHLDHIDGNPRNNVIENLRLLCPNCHSQTDTYCGKNYNRNKKSNHCLGCDKKLSSTWATRCIQCFSDLKSSQTKIIWPDKETLTNLIKTRKMEYIAKKLGVTSSSIKKHCKKIGIDYQDAKYGM